MSLDDSGRTFRTAYQHETVPILRNRLSVAMAIFVFFMGVGTIFEVHAYPERASFALLLYGIEAVVAIAGALACWLPRMREHAATIAALTSMTLAACINTYHGAVHAQAERVAIVLGCVLNTLSVTLPWGWVAQTGAAIGSLVTYLIAGPHLVTPDSFGIPVTVLLSAGTTSIWGAFFLDRYRYEAFRRTALQTEEAEIAAALAHVGETLSQHLGEPDVLEHVNRLAVSVLGCDFASLFLMNDQRNVYWLAANVGSRPEVVDELKHLEFPPDSMPLLEMLRPGELLEISDASRDTRVPPELCRRLDVSSELLAPIARRDQIIGVLVVGYAQRIGHFSSRERRLAHGIAHATAITLENGRLIADLQSANRLKSEFVATMSHELRTPLNVIMGYTEMLADRAFDPDKPEWQGTLARIQEHSVGLLELVNATLDMGRLESGRETVTEEEVDLTRLLADLARELKPLAPEGVTLTWICGLGRGRIMTDGAKLKTILKNLIGNALKFTPAGSVHVEARPSEDAEGTEQVTFSVADSGIGIAAEHLSMVFEMFRQVDSSPTRRFSGVGLGLHIAKRLVELLGGTIRVQSTAAVGSTFTVTIPLHRPPASLVQDEPRRTAQ
jgi:signal transduction histidine kinase